MAQVVKVMVSVLVNETDESGDEILAKDVQSVVEAGLQIGLDSMANSEDTSNADANVIDQMITINTDYSI